MKCKYCNKFSGIFSSVHKECEEKHHNALSEIAKAINNCFVEPLSLYSEIEEHLNALCADGYVKREEFDDILFKNVRKYAFANFIDDGFLQSYLKTMPYEIRAKIENDPSYINKKIKSVEKELDQLSLEEIVPSELSNKIETLSSYPNPQSIREGIEKKALAGFEKRIEHALEDGILDDEEETLIDDYIKKTHLLNKSILTLSQSYNRMVQALILKDLQTDKTTTRVNVTNLPILLGKQECIAWVYQRVSCFEEKTGTRYTSNSMGVSMRICKGVYYHIGASKGKPINYQYHNSLGKGILVITNKNIFFCGDKTIKLPINKILSYKIYSDGIELVKDGVNPKPYTFTQCDPWFIINVVQLLTE